MEELVPIVIKKELDNSDRDELKIKAKPMLELDEKTSPDNFLCSICQNSFTNLKCFFYHLETHYLPESPEHFQCSVCQETCNAQVDFYFHVRVHYRPSLMAELGGSITVLLKSREKIEETDSIGEGIDNDDIDNDDSDVSYEPPDDDSDPDFEFEESKHLKQEMKWGKSFSDQDEPNDGRDQDEPTVDDDNSRKQFSCPLCSKTESQPSYEHFLKHHVCDNAGQKGHVCDLCHKWFPQLYRLVRHQAMHTSARPFACVKCHKSFKTNDALEKHLQLYKDGECSRIPIEKPYACDTCGTRYQVKRSLQRHSCHLLGDVKKNIVTKKSVDNDKQDTPAVQRVYTCEKCGATYQTGRSLKRHLLNHHSGVKLEEKIHKEEKEEDVVGEYSCTQCQLKFTLKRFLNTHICHKLRKVAEKNCQCDLCGKAFSAPSHLNRHQLAHMKETPFKCTECPKSFKTETEQKKHMTSHTGEEIQCEFCEQMCKGLPSYKLHIKRKHRYKLDCEVCKREFCDKSSFRTHMRTHTNEKPFVCTECGLSFYSFSGLCNHKKFIHTDFKKVRERTHICDLCGKGFFTKDRLKVHTESHIESKNHLCTECGRGFNCNYKLKRHMERHRIPEIPCLHCNLLFTCKANLRKHVIRRHKHVVKVKSKVE